MTEFEGDFERVAIITHGGIIRLIIYGFTKREDSSLVTRLKTAQ